MLQNGRWLGSKEATGAYQAIIAAMPPHDTYIETHLGSGAVMRHKPPAARSIGVEKDAAAIAAFDYGDVEIVHGDGEELLAGFDYAAGGRVLIYADPPYLPEVAPSSKRYRFGYTREDHERLIRLLRSLPANVMLSGYPSALYEKMLPDWRSIRFQVMTRGGVRTEQLWMNYPEGPLHWASFAGRNFTERQSIKRKAERWAAKFGKLPERERVAVLAAILQHSQS